MIKAILFDLDGLLIDSEVISFEIYRDIVSRYGYKFSKDEYAQNYSGKAEIINVRKLIQEYHLPITLEEGLHMVASLEKKLLEKGVELKSGAKKVLAYLRTNHYKMAIASSSTKERAMCILEQHEILAYFDAFVFGHEVEKGKPYPDIFLKAIQKLSENPEDCLILEDGEAGIQAGYSANIPVICIPDMKQPSEEYRRKTVAVLESLEDVIAYVEERKRI